VERGRDGTRDGGGVVLVVEGFPAVELQKIMLDVSTCHESSLNIVAINLLEIPQPITG